MLRNKYTFYITFKMAKKLKELEKSRYSVQEALSIIISDDYTLGTSSSDEDTSQLSYSGSSTDTNEYSPSPKAKTTRKIFKKRRKNDMYKGKHDKPESRGVSQTYVRPSSEVPLSPAAAKKSDTPSAVDVGHDNFQLEHLQDTVPMQISPQEFVMTIPLDIIPQNPENEQEQEQESTLQTDILPQNVNNNREVIQFPPEYFTNLEGNISSSDIETEENNYVIEMEDNEHATPFEEPIINYDRDIELQEDIDDGWEKILNDQVPDYCHFIGHQGLNMGTISRNPEDFFNELFDERMYTIIAEETNNYARQQIMKAMGDRDPFQNMDHYSYKRHARLGTWKDLNSSDIKIFIAHLLVMSSVRKPALHSYWSTNSLSRTPFFGQYLGRNKFQDILWNIHVVADTSTNPPPGVPDHDPLAKVRPFVRMCQDNFRVLYKPSENISIDESTLAFKVEFL